ncbi:MAG TPA: SNF2-related protein [Acidimicrobiales bacterium]|nr:SNF2-related protein [Acidimicrobiales bacterium]
MLAKSDEVALRALIGPTTLARGRDYARNGAVETVEWDPSGSRVAGRVRGRAAESYTVTVLLARRPDGRLRSVTGDCSCPVGWNCKHAVALLLSSGDAEAEAGDGDGQANSKIKAPSPPQPSREAAGSWASALEAVIAPGRRTSVPAGTSDVLLGLQFELVPSRPAPRRTGDRPPGPGVRLRPVTLSDRGNWVRNGISWSNLDYLQGWRNPRRAAPLELLLELRALGRLSDARRWTTSGEESVWLESVASRRVWDLLAEAEAAGVALVGASRPAGPVVMEKGPASAVLDVSRRPAGGLCVRGVVLPAAVTGAGPPPAPGSLLLVGRPAHGLVWWSGPPTAGPPLHLAPFDAPLTEAVAALLSSPQPLTVPEEGVARFEGELLPGLRRRVPVVCGDGSYPLPVVEPDRVMCQVVHAPHCTLDVEWALESGGGSRREVTDDPDPAAEKALGRVVDVLGWLNRLVVGAGGRLLPAPGRLSGMAAARFVAEVIPALEAIDQVEVVQEGEAPDYREVTDAPEVRLRAAADEPTGTTDWLDLAVEVTVGGETVPFEELFVALAEGASHLVLPSGGYFSLDRVELRRLAELIVEARSLHDAPPGQVRLNRFSASLYEELAELGGTDAPGWADALRSLAGTSPSGRPVPAGLEAELRPYQQEGFGWLADRFERRLGAVLADDMGLGKTLQALAVVCDGRRREPEAGPFLVVAPASVVGGWVSEASRFAPQLKVTALTETSRRRGVPLTEVIEGADLVVTSYSLFRLDYDELKAQSWGGLLLDEAQFVKNPSSRAAGLARTFPCEWKMAMTGTPLENSLAELWSLLAITCPGLLGRPDRFDAAYRLPIERRGDTECLERLRRRLRPVMLRRTKAEVLADLPEKQELVVELDLDPRHQRRYQAHLQRERQKLLGLIGDMQANRFEILRSLTTLRQAALDVSLVDSEAAGVPSTKLEHLDVLLAEAVADGHRVLVFSQFTRFLQQARRRADQAGIASCYLDGRTRKRAEVIERFRSEAAPVFFISLKAGGFGLNLTEADHAVLLDPWWNPATEAQAVDRIHRIGQTRKVMVHRLIARGTIEDKVMALKERKARLFDSVMGADGFASPALTAADVAALLD